MKDDNGTSAVSGDDAVSASQTFTISVTAVNDVPSFVKGADQTVLEDAGAQTILNWATGISAGPANESSQAVSLWCRTTTAVCSRVSRWWRRMGR